MKITKSRLKRIIKEELGATLNEQPHDASQQLKDLVKEAIRSSSMGKMSPDVLTNQNVRAAIEKLHDAVLNANWG